MRRSLWPLFFVLAGASCQGVIGEAPGADTRAGARTGRGRAPDSPEDQPGSGEPSPTSTASGGATGTDPDAPPSVGESPLRRLARNELENTLRDLFPGVSADFDSKVELPADNDIQLAFALPGTVSDLEVKRFMDLAEATLGALGDSAPNRKVTCGGVTETDCARTFVSSFGKRAFRRPLDGVEVDDLMALYTKLRSDPDMHYGFQEALGVVVEAMLQAPAFLYRWERGLAAPQLDGPLVRFDAYELASRLSYFIWNSMPDDALMAAADDGKLGTADELAAQATRLLENPRADATLSDFVAQWLELGPLPQLIKDGSFYPAFQPSLLGSLKAETTDFARDVLRGPTPTFESLLTADYTIVDAPLARYYGVSPDGEGRVDLAGTARLGVLTQGALMAVKGNSYRTSPVRRGKFILNRLLCVTVPPPPPNVVPELPPPDPSMTLREQMAMHRDNPSCSVCHSRMDPLGFAFEHFDGAGNYRPDDGGHPIDSSGSLTLDGTDVQFGDASDLARALGASPEAHECFTRQWLRYAIDRFERFEDERAVAALTGSYEASGLDTRRLIVDITRAFPFSHRAPADGEDLTP